MQRLGELARTICALGLASSGVPREDIPAMVERFWPVVANEAHDSVTVIGVWPFTDDEIAMLAEDYRAIVGPHSDGGMRGEPASILERH
ncbi:hypothetical protein [Ancylobacter defluvii]|uniref:Uncharacterized protein n=1 Tax=Ancylobacter defluvii TaxID=1282440 RepID=A0A9W6JVB3_9HYPH|nr:hypothetical protein [Ancylobacter defluvii]MBS7590148.1 hypothetical protein [Ancylobacter defluvii]GLK82775.1 hypothetical protein GCM10017653_08440 [Ancylobacter defluvii]